MDNQTNILNSLEAEKARLEQSNSWPDLPASIKYALQRRIQDIDFSIEKLRAKL